MEADRRVDIDMLDKIQRRTTKLISGLRDLSFEEILNKFGQDRLRLIHVDTRTNGVLVRSHLGCAWLAILLNSVKQHVPLLQFSWKQHCNHYDIQQS